MSTLSLVGKWEEAKKNYVEFLNQNLGFVTTAESWMKTLSYLVAGRISTTHSSVIAELLYASSNLLTLLNDHLLRKHHKLYKLEDESIRWIKSVLAAIECVEVFIEIAARRYGSDTFKWILVFCVELVKTIGRFILLCKKKTSIRLFPIIKRLNRKHIESDSSDDSDDQQAQVTQSADRYYTLSHSGRKIKSVTHKYGLDETRSEAPPHEPVPLSHEQMFAESLHNLQPLIYLLTNAVFGEKSWIPWMASLVTDVTSLKILLQPQLRYSKVEGRELLRRKFVLVMYLLRSPCYDRYTRLRILRVLALISKIPGTGLITEACKAYLPEWQRTYFYTWSS